MHIPDDPRALAAYEAGKQYYYSRRGQLDLACASCHVQNAGRTLRGVTVSAGLGQVAHWPAHRLEWGELAPLQRRFMACNEQTGTSRWQRKARNIATWNISSPT